MSFPSSDQYSAKQMEAALVNGQAGDDFGFACKGYLCPSKTNCRRTTDTNHLFAAFHNRREAGDSACVMYLPIKVVTTLKDEQ
mgnify:CR=1 FL=1